MQGVWLSTREINTGELEVFRVLPCYSRTIGTGKPKFTKPIHTKGDISRSLYPGQLESETDFRYALALMRRGYSDEDVFQRIQKERENWEKKSSESLKRKYIERTVKNARGDIDGSSNTTTSPT